MKRLQALLLFRKRLLPGLVVSALIGVLIRYSADGDIFKSTLASYSFITPMFHYFAYDVINRDEYYFYANFGLSKFILWAITIGIALLCLIISAFL